jgi:hypothetical protein
VLVVRWVDRLRRDYADDTEVIRRFMTCGVVITTVINGRSTGRRTTPSEAREGRPDRLHGRSSGGSIPHFQKLANLVAANSVYLTVCWMLAWPSHAWMARVSWPAFARAYPQPCLRALVQTAGSGPL